MQYNKLEKISRLNNDVPFVQFLRIDNNHFLFHVAKNHTIVFPLF
jgi:hypothetical protein